MQHWILNSLSLLCLISIVMSCGGGGGSAETIQDVMPSSEPVYKGKTIVNIDFETIENARQKSSFHDIDLVEAKVTYLSVVRTIALTKVVGSVASYEAVLDSLPLGVPINIEILAKDSQGEVIYRGSQSTQLASEDVVSLPIHVHIEDQSFIKPPVIEGVRLLTNHVLPGDNVSLEVLVDFSSSSPNEYHYLWTASAGSFSGNTSKVSTWYVPEIEGTYDISVEVTRGGASTSFNFQLAASLGGTIQPEIIFAPTLLGVDLTWNGTLAQLVVNYQSQAGYLVEVDWLHSSTRVRLGQGNTFAIDSGGTLFNHDLIIAMSYEGQTLQVEYPFNLSLYTPPQIVIGSDSSPLPPNTLSRHKRLDINDYTKEAYFVDDDGYVWVVKQSVDRNYQAVKIEGIDNVIDIDCGDCHVIALKADGSVWGWGWNGAGELGLGVPIYEIDYPAEIEVLKDIVDIAVGSSHSMALNSSGNIYIWGYNRGTGTDLNKGYLGTGNFDDERHVLPTLMTKVPKAVSISGGQGYSHAVLADGRVMGWGENEWNELGDGTDDDRFEPVVIEGLSNVKYIESTWYHSMALLKDGSLRRWGFMAYNGPAPDHMYGEWLATPQVFADGQTAVSIALGHHHGSLLTSSGEVKSWGSGWEGATGLGGDESSPIYKKLPATSPYFSNVKFLAAGMGSGACVTQDGSWYIWGNDWMKIDGVTSDEYVPQPVSYGQ